MAPKRLFRQDRAAANASQKDDRRVVADWENQPKMADVLKEFVGPYWEVTKSGDELDQVISLGTLAWNTALLPFAEHQASIDKGLTKLLPSAPESIQAQARTIIDVLIRRKTDYYAADRRTIVGFELSGTQTGYTLRVGWTV